MVLQSEHRRGIGNHLTVMRINEIRNERPDLTIVLETSQHTFRFYERFGFETRSIKPDGFGPGLDEYVMALEPITEVDRS